MPKKLPQLPPIWATDPGVTLEPSGSEKALGWPVGFKPPARWQNWWQNAAYLFIDNLQAILLRDWQPGLPISTTAGPTDTIRDLGFHKGQFAQISNEGANGELRFSTDGRNWRDANLSVSASGVGTLASNNSRLIVGRIGDGAQYSDNDGTSFLSCAGFGAFDDVRAYYLEQAGLWVARGSGDSNLCYQSSDGATFTSIAGSAPLVSAQRRAGAENADGSIIMVGDRFSVNGGSSWALQSNIPAGLVEIMFSSIRDDFIASGSGGMYGTTAPGVWDTTPFDTLADCEKFFEMRGALFCLRTGPNSTQLTVSIDAGLSWDTVKEFGDDDVALSNAAGQVAHYSGQSDAGFALVSGGNYALCPLFGGNGLT